MAQTHFGYQTVDEHDKAARVRGVFDSVAQRYDLMNDLLSFGMHRAWKAYTVAVANVKRGDKVLDIAGGTGDLARAFAPRSDRRAWWCTPTSTKRCCASAATACWTKAWRCPR
jgi:ubiquinone/menaquinone biosynthesis C-methylase UbiE